MVKLRALKELRYDGVNHFPGAEFEATEAHAKLLKAIGKCEDAPELKPTRASLRKAAMAPAPDTAPEPAKTAEVSDPRIYNRRDMKAED